MRTVPHSFLWHVTVWRWCTVTTFHDDKYGCCLPFPLFFFFGSHLLSYLSLYVFLESHCLPVVCFTVFRALVQHHRRDVCFLSNGLWALNWRMVICVFQKDVILALINIFSIVTLQVTKNNTEFFSLANLQQYRKNYLGIIWTNNITLFILYVFGYLKQFSCIVYSVFVLKCETEMW